MAINDFKILFINELKGIYNAKTQLIAGMPRIIEAIESAELKSELKTHLGETQKQIERLRQIFQMLEVEETGRNCHTMRDLIEECDQAISNYSSSSVKDAAIIAIAQRIAHYEMAVYGALRTFAKQLNYKEIADLLQISLDEEGRANKKLTKIAEGGFFASGVNQLALR